MHAPNLPDLRRSSRLPIALPILVTSLEPDSDFSEVCETLVVSAHGCAMRSSIKLDVGAPVQFESKDGRWTMAHIVDCQPMDSDEQGWMLGAKLDQPDNFWGLETCPDDWSHLAEVPRRAEQPPRGKKVPKNGHLRAEIAEFIEPLQAEIKELREKLTQGASKRSQFDISLTHIPPEVEEKIWLRLREDLGAQALRQTRQQSEQVFEATKEAIGKKISEAHSEFREQLGQELQVVEQRAQDLSGEITDAVQKHLLSGAERFQQQVLEAGIRLERRSEEFLRAMQQRLSEEHDMYRREVQKVQVAVASESSRLQAQNAELANRMAKLDESARQLESSLESRLIQMSGDIISGARTQLERALDVVLKELGTRNAKELGKQLDGACAQLKSVQKGIESSVSQLLKTEVAGGLLSFGQTMEELAQDSVGRWRNALAKDLSSVTKILGGEFRADAVTVRKGSQHSSGE
jgi:hypothetical protein